MQNAEKELCKENVAEVEKDMAKTPYKKIKK